MQVIRHCFHLNEGIAVVSTDFLDCLLYSILNLAFDYLVAVLRTKNDVVVDIVDAVAYFPFHATIITSEQLFVNVPVALSGDAPFIPRDEPVGFQGQSSIKPFGRRSKSFID